MPDVLQAHNDLVAHFAARKPHRIVLDPDPEDYLRRARDIDDALSACRSYLVVLIADAGDHEPGAVIREADLIGTLEGQFADLAGDVVGRLETVAERIADTRYGDAWPAPRHAGRRARHRV
jgi:hypothetical protein